MRLVVLLALALAACANGPSYVRDPEGRQLPTTARLDADMDPATVWCGARRYVIVEPPPSYLSGHHMATHEVRITDAAGLCMKIRAAE